MTRLFNLVLFLLPWRKSQRVMKFSKQKEVAWTQVLWKWHQLLNNGEFTTVSAGFACDFALCCNWSLPHSVGRCEYQSWALTSPSSVGVSRESLLPSRNWRTCDSHLLLIHLRSHWGQTPLCPWLRTHHAAGTTQSTRATGAAFAFCQAVPSSSLPTNFRSLYSWADFQCVVFSSTETMPAAETIISSIDCL